MHYTDGDPEKRERGMGMGRIGTVPPSTYSLGNMLNGTTTQSVINPET